MKQITYSQLHDHKGDFVAIKLHQGDQSITISLEPSNPNRTSGYKWDEVKEIVNTISQKVYHDVTKAIK